VTASGAEPAEADRPVSLEDGPTMAVKDFADAIAQIQTSNCDLFSQPPVESTPVEAAASEDAASPDIGHVPDAAYATDITYAAVASAAAAPDMRIEFDDRTAVMMQRLTIWKDELIAWFKTLASAAVYATLIVTFGFQVARVEGQSMAPTLADQDRLIVNKLAYRMGEPRRGDIVMLYYPLNPDKSFVKRVIAEEGDQVRIVDGRVYVNDVPMRDDFVPPEYRSHDDFGPTVIPEGYYFVMGDHRNNSSDSRHWGMVPKKYIIGKVQLRWWPLPTARVF
jgi:signal peptidase I